VQVIGVPAVVLGAHVDEHDDRTIGEESAVDELSRDNVDAALG